MKQTNRTDRYADAGRAFTTACLASCKKMLAQIKTVKTAIFKESSAALSAQAHLLELALNEAEALAWETEYPHLLFPALAMEKVRAVSDWNEHQQSVRRANGISALAA